MCVQLHHYYPICTNGFFIFWLDLTITLGCFIVHTCISRSHRLYFLDIFIIWHLIRVFTVCKTLLIQHVQESVVYKRLMLIRWLVLLFQESHWRALGAVSDSSKRRKHIRYGALEECPSCCLCSSGNHARTHIDLGLPVHHLHRLHVHVPSCCILLTSFFNCWWPPSTRQVWMYAPSNLQCQNTKSSSLKLKIQNTMIATALGTLFYTTGISNLWLLHPKAWRCTRQLAFGTRRYHFVTQSGLPRQIPRNSMESDHGCTSWIYFNNVSDNVMLMI